MKIIEFITCLHDGGAETLVKDYARNLRNRGHEVKILVLYPVCGTAVSTMVRELGIQVVSIYSSWNIFNRTLNKTFGKKLIPSRIKRILRQEQPDVLHVHLALLKYIRDLSRELSNTRLFYTCHCPANLFFCGERADEGDAARVLLDNNNMQIIALHEEMRQDINSLFGINNTAVLKNGVDFRRFRDVKESSESIRKSIGIPCDSFVVGHVGRFSNQKNHEKIIGIFDNLLRRRSDAYLLLVGIGPKREEVKSLVNEMGIANRVLFLENRTDVHRLMKAMDVFLFPSLFEGLSVTLVEAQAAGLRCVVSDKINQESILSENTVVVPLEDSDAEWCDYILSNEIVNSEHGNLEEYNITSVVDELEKMYLGSYKGRFS